MQFRKSVLSLSTGIETIGFFAFAGMSKDGGLPHHSLDPAAFFFLPLTLPSSWFWNSLVLRSPDHIPAAHVALQSKMQVFKFSQDSGQSWKLASVGFWFYKDLPRTHSSQSVVSSDGSVESSLSLNSVGDFSWVTGGKELLPGCRNYSSPHSETPQLCFALLKS